MHVQEPWVQTLNQLLSLGTIVAIGVIVALVGILATKGITGSKVVEGLKGCLHKLLFATTFLGTFLTLFYSEYIGYAPCPLCWLQRVFLYPQVVLFAIAMWKKDSMVFLYSLALSFFGGAIALYHHLLQMGYDLYKPCSTAPFAVSCSKPDFVEFGFVTFPFMALVLFTFIGVLSYIGMRVYKKEA